MKAEAVNSGLPRCMEIARDIRRKKLDECSGDAVLFIVAPTRIHVVRRNPWVWNWSSLSAYTKCKWRLLETKDLHYYFLIDMPRLSIVTTNVDLCCSLKQDPRLLLVTAIDEHAGVMTC